MADLLVDAQAGYTGTPASGKSGIFVDSSSKKLFTKDDAGRYWGAPIRNWSVTNDASAFASDLYVVGSNVLIPSFGLQVGSRYMLRVSASKTGAGVATPVYTLRCGAGGVVGDAVFTCALTGPAQTAIADIATLNVIAIVRTTGATGTMQATAWWEHRGTTANTTTSGTGFANDSTGHVEANFTSKDMTTSGGLYLGMSLNGGASDAVTVTLVDAQLDV